MVIRIVCRNCGVELAAFTQDLPHCEVTKFLKRRYKNECPACHQPLGDYLKLVDIKVAHNLRVARKFVRQQLKRRKRYA